MTHRFLFVALSAAGLLGCPTTPSTDDTGPLTFPDCEAIIEACHDVTAGGPPGPAADCHDAAHDADSNDDCAPTRAMCVMLCQAIDGGVVHDEDAPDHDHDGGH